MTRRENYCSWIWGALSLTAGALFVKWGHVNPWKSAVNSSLIWQEEDFLRLQWGLPSGMRTHPPNSSSTFYCWLLFQILLFTAREFNLPLPGNYIVRETHLPNSTLPSHCHWLSFLLGRHIRPLPLHFVQEFNQLYETLPMSSLYITPPGNSTTCHYKTLQGPMYNCSQGSTWTNDDCLAQCHLFLAVHHTPVNSTKRHFKTLHCKTLHCTTLANVQVQPGQCKNYWRVHHSLQLWSSLCHSLLSIYVCPRPKFDPVVLVTDIFSIDDIYSGSASMGTNICHCSSHKRFFTVAGRKIKKCHEKCAHCAYHHKSDTSELYHPLCHHLCTKGHPPSS